MDYPKPTTETKDADEAREQFGEVLDRIVVTGHRELRRLGRYGDVTILTPQEFLALVEAEANSE